MTPTPGQGPYQRLEVTREGAVAVITLKFPPANALGPPTLQELDRALDGIEGDATARAVVVTGGAGRFFSAGADVNEFAQSPPEELARYIGQGTALWGRIESFPKVVIAALNGFALGGGAELALACDIRIAAESARLGLPEITLGLLPGWGGMPRLARLIGRGRALEAVLSGRAIEAREALAVGLFSAVVPDGQLAAKALEVAGEMARRPPLAVAEVKHRFARGQNESFQETVRGDMEAFLRVLKTRDAREGVRAFLEKRPPRFEGK